MNESKREHLEDTHFGITWQKFIEIAKAYGFECGFCEKFTGTAKKGVKEEEIIFFHKEKGLILYAESYCGNSVCGATVYGEVKNKETFERKHWNVLNGCSYDCNPNGTISFEASAMQGLCSRLNAISEEFEFSTNWTKIPFLNFQNYMDSKEDDCVKKINQQKIEACKPEVRKIIFG